MAAKDVQRAGAALFAGSAQFTFFLVVAQAYFPGYSISGNYISDLGAFCDSVCVVNNPSSTIFTVSVVLLGALLLASAYYFRRAFKSRLVPSTILLTAVGAIGVGFFSETFGYVHAIFSVIAFLFAGLTAVASYPTHKRPMSYFSVVLGITTIAALALYIPKIYLGLGPGGMESVVVYPVLIWGIGFGAYLMGRDGDSP